MTDQVIYRNGSSALGTAWTALQISWAWRKRAHNNLLRSFVVILPPLTVFAGFATASVLSAKVAAPPTAASQVKLLPRNCGYMDWSTKSNAIGEVTQDGGQVYGRFFVNDAIKARSYARSCYDDAPNTIGSCDLYPVSKLPYTTNDEAPCPFGGHRCILGDNRALQMQTPWLNSHEHFGINAPPQDRVEWRKTTTCSVLNVTDRVSTVYSNYGTTHVWHLGYSGPLLRRTNQTYWYNENIVNLNLGYTIRLVLLNFNFRLHH